MPEGCRTVSSGAGPAAHPALLLNFDCAHSWGRAQHSSCLHSAPRQLGKPVNSSRCGSGPALQPGRHRSSQPGGSGG
jgi:hypothetical protein